MQSRHSMHSMLGRVLTSNQESCAIGTKLVPEGGEEVDELEDLGAGGAAGEGPIDASWHQEQHKAGQKPYCLHHSTLTLVVCIVAVCEDAMDSCDCQCCSTNVQVAKLLQAGIRCVSDNEVADEVTKHTK